MRGINERFINDLTLGRLTWFLNKVKDNNELCLEVRENYVNIYYKGGNALRIRQTKNDYRFEFDEKYCLDEEVRNKVKALCSLEDYRDNFNLLLTEMDAWFSVHPKTERKIQHELIKYNTCDFCILDIEYAGSYFVNSNRKSFRFDMVATYNEKLVIIENKNGEKSMGGKSGIAKHYNDICYVIDDSEARNTLIKSMSQIADNKKALGLSEANFSGKEIEILFLSFNCNDKSHMLANQMTSIPKKHPAKIIFLDAAASKIYYENAEAMI